MQLRNATLNDITLVFNWANDPITRQNSFNSNEISWESHTKWFSNFLQNKDSYMYIFTENNLDIGLVRIETKHEETIIGVIIAPNHRGNSYASRIINIACLEFWKTNSNTINAYIKPENFASKKAFKNAGFTFLKTSEIKDITCEIHTIEK